MVVGEASIHNIMGGMESTGGVRLHNHKRKLKQRFDIIKKLGQGTYGKVQLGINKETGQEVAIKTIKKCKIETEADLIRIRREIQIMSSVQHPNIIHIYEVFENREKMVLVMEYAAGGELYDYLSERKVLSEQEARRIFRQIATAVFYCHKHKICHRDLKLENILLDQVGNAKIADFGLSNVFDEQRLLSTFCGSPLYASPEIVKGTPYHGPEVDCWSLGVLLYTLVYGAMPFDGSNFKRLVKQISQSDYFEPKKPSPASPLIKEMLTVVPSKRADIEKICTHWWVNEGYEQSCLDIAEDLAAQTPVRLDLLLSIVPQSASAEKLVVGDQQTNADVANNTSSETLVPTRCHSVGSLMELDQNSSDRRIREMLEEEPRSSAAGDAKRKLETTPSMDETVAAGVKKKERSRRKERTDEREPRAYRSTSRHHSAPIPNAITEEAMEVDPAVNETVPTTKTADQIQVEASAACLELIQECKEKSPSKERSKTPVAKDELVLPKEISTEYIQENENLNKEESKEIKATEKCTKSPTRSVQEDKSPVNTSIETNEHLSNAAKPDVPNSVEVKNEEDSTALREVGKTESPTKETKRLKEKALSLDSELSTETMDVPLRSTERRRSKIFETAEKFNQMSANTESEKPKKIFIPGVNVGGAKRAFERKASLSSITSPPAVKSNASKVIIDASADKKSEKNEEKTTPTQELDAEQLKREEAKKRAVDIITGAIGKPPVQRKINGSPPVSPQSPDTKKIGLKIQVAPNDIRSATVSISSPVGTKYAFDQKPQPTTASSSSEIEKSDNAAQDEPKMSSKMEITLKSATLPRPRKTSKAEITLSGMKSPENVAFKSEVEAKIDAFQPQKLRTQRSEVAFPVAAAVSFPNRSSSLEPESKSKPKERIIPIQVEPGHQKSPHSSTPPPKPPMPQRSMSQRSGSLSRQSTADSDTDSALGSTIGPEPIRKSPREYIIPIAVEGGGYVTPRSGSVEPESNTSTPTSANAPRTRFGRPRRMSSLLSDASEDESPFSSLHRDSEDLLQRHMHRLRSSRPSRQPSEHADSLSSGEDDDDDGFELLTAENLFSTLLSRVRSLTQRLNVDDNRSTGFPSSRLLGRLGSNSSQAFWGLNKPLSRRLSESQFKHSLSRDSDIFSRKESGSSSNPGTPSSPGSRSTPTRGSAFEMGSNTLPRDKVEHEDIEAEKAQIRKEAQDSLEQSFTPSLARRLSRHFIEQTRQSLPRSPSLPRDRYYQSPTRETLSLIESGDAPKRHSTSTTSDQSEYRGRSLDRSIRRTNSLLEPGSRNEYRSPRRSISLFDDDDRMLPPLPRQVMTLGRKYKDIEKTGASNIRRENFHSYRTDKIQEEPFDEGTATTRENENAENNVENGSVSECTSISVCNSNTNLVDTTSSVSIRSYETSPTESSSNIIDLAKSSYKSESSKNFEDRLLAAENLIKESKLKNLGPSKFNPNLSSSYVDTDKCEKQPLCSITDSSSSIVSKRRSCIPSLRLRSGSLTRESSIDRRKSFAGSQDNITLRALSPERSILSKFFRAGSCKETEPKDKTQKPKQRRISRFLRPDFFDTPREESQYVKEKEAQKLAENERRKSRFIKRKNENKSTEQQEKTEEVKPEKELKNEVNSLRKDNLDTSSSDDKSRLESSESSKPKIERQSSRNSFLHSLEKKLEKFRSNDEASKPIANGDVSVEQKTRAIREKSAPPAEHLRAESRLLKRAISTENVTLEKASPNSSKSRVSSVLGLFKSDNKSSSNGQRPQNAILSKLKKSPPKSTKSDSSLSEDAPSTSKIPTKSLKNDVKSLTKKNGESKKSPEKVVAEPKRSPLKEKIKEKVSEEKKKSPSEKQAKESKKESEGYLKKSSPEKTASPERNNEMKNQLNDFPEQKALVSKTADNKQTENNCRADDKKFLKTKKNISSLGKTTVVKKEEKGEDAEKKVKKVVKVKSSGEKEETDTTKKKKIVRVVKKVVKKSSDSSDSKSEEKEKPTQTLIKRITSSPKEKSPESTNNKVKENKSDSQDVLSKSASKVTSNNKEVANNLDVNVLRNKSSEKSASSSKFSLKSDVTATDNKGTTDSTNKIASTNSISKISSLESNGNSKLVERRGSNLKSEFTQERNKKSPSDSNIVQHKPTEHRTSRHSLKLDLSKIPQHTFRNVTPKREIPKTELTKRKSNSSTESPKVEESDSSPNKLLDTLSKMTHHANITGNKIIIDKPLRAEDVADLKKVAQDEEKPMEKKMSSPESIKEPVVISQQRERIEEKVKASTPEKVEAEKKVMKGSPVDQIEDLLSPGEETESFDSWSICSADLNHGRNDLHSPTSSLYTPSFMGGESAESVIDRIRRRSFYTRFNDRKRQSLTAPPPGVSLPSSSTLPRKYSLREKDRSKLSAYSGTSKRQIDRSLSLYNDDVPSYRKSPTERFSDGGVYHTDTKSFSADLKSPISTDTKSYLAEIRSPYGTDVKSTYSPGSKSPVDQYGTLTSCTYDPLRKYLRSPTSELSSSRRRYHSTDFSSDNDLGTYRPTLTGSSLSSDGLYEPYSCRTSGTLPRKYGSTVSSTDPKSVEYFEELLAPSNPEYLTMRKSPLSNEYHGRYENGYHNGSLDLPQYYPDKWKSQPDRIGSVELVDDNGGGLAEKLRSSSRHTSEAKDMPSTSAEPQSNAYTAE